MPYKDRAKKLQYLKQYYLRTRKSADEIISKDNLMNDKMNELIQENKKLKRIIFLHNIGKNEEENDSHEVIKTEESNDDLDYYKEKLNEYIDKLGENTINNKLLLFETEFYEADKCESTNEKCYFYNDFLEYLNL